MKRRKSPQEKEVIVVENLEAWLGENQPLRIIRITLPPRKSSSPPMNSG
jgi:hypothetical protein